MKAQQENSLEKELKQLETSFEERGIILRPISQFSDFLLLGEIDETFGFLDSLTSGLNVLLSSRFSACIKKQAEILQKNVLFLSELMKKWLDCQT